MKLQSWFIILGERNRVLVLLSILAFNLPAQSLNMSMIQWWLFGGTCILSALWLKHATWINKQWLLPLQFRYVRCYHCRWWINLTQIWGMAGGSHRDHRCQHVLQYHDPEGREISAFQCPRKDCINPTIQVQRGVDSKVHRGQILGNADIVPPTERPPSLLKVLVAMIRNREASNRGMPVGDDRSHQFTRFQRWLRKAFNRSLQQRVYIGESGYGCSMNVFGKSGKGKSTLLQSFAQWVAESDHGATFIDPHGDLITDILKLIPVKRRDDVKLIRVSDPENPLGCNVLDANNAQEAATLRSEVILAIKRLSESWGGNIETDIDYAIETVQKVGGTLSDVYDLFVSSAVRDHYVRQLDPVADEEFIAFWHDYDKRKADARASVKNKLRKIVKHPLLGPIVSAQHTIDPDTAIQERQIILVDLSTGDGDISDTVNRMLGTILFIKVVSAAFRQLKLPEHERARHFLFVDEAGSFMHKGMDWQRVYSQARKVKLSLVLACQQLSQLTSDVLDGMWGNAGVILSFTVAEKDGKELAQNFPDTTVEDFTQQQNFECIARINESLVYRIKTQLPQRPIVDQTQYITDRMKALQESSQTVNRTPIVDNDVPMDSRFFVNACRGVR